MRILEIREQSVSLQSNIRNSVVDFSQMTCSVIAIITDVIREGKPVIGYGFNSIGRYAVSSTLRDRLIPRIMQADPESILDSSGKNLDPFKIWDIMMKNEKQGGNGDRAHAVGAVDMAVWDTVAKIEGVPLWKLLSDRFNHGQYDDQVFTYAAGGYYYPGKGLESLKYEVKSYLDRGYTAVKIKIGGATLDEDVKRIEAVMEVMGSGNNVAVDANGRFDLEKALAYGKAISPYNLMWYEEAGDPHDYQLHATLSEHYTGPMATGENLFSLQEARNLIRYGGMRPDRDFLQFDCGLGYGLVEYLRILNMLEMHGWSRRRCIPHGGHQMCLNIAAGLQIGGNECYPDVFKPIGGLADHIPVDNGYILLPDIPGVGFEAKNDVYTVLKQVGSQ
ncbi:mandelate racemase/muconate lactonizing enzyme family protein [Fictibacillus enclensis]|uniref:mandelate racemase/muconate lactonizing enzyme family protein n=1 Tax=Fictibacillus enclensis TaxID=1017270 RepID=UPI0025A2CFE5|nr:mandelate racemase/muconate lactonizing enzyme family protein [Fictibacillus enclensis]MDM5339056.1 mandelate racemase/muconate lactonizing enzyme family protein [Fictibacillus enclensis]